MNIIKAYLLPKKNIKIIQHQYASQTPPILSFSGYLTDDELSALDAADPRKALSEFGASWSFLNTVCPFRK